MSNLIDSLGAIFIAGFVLLGLLTITLFVREQETNTNMDNMVQMTTTNVSSIIESDFRKIGFRVGLTETKILAADSTSITFRSDVDSSGTVDTVRYYLGTTTQMATTQNPNDRPLFRVVNGTTHGGSNFGCTSFNLIYYDSLGAVTTTPANIRSILVKMNIESTQNSNQRYAGAYWTTRIKPMNLSRKY